MQVKDTESIRFQATRFEKQYREFKELVAEPEKLSSQLPDESRELFVSFHSSLTNIYRSTPQQQSFADWCEEKKLPMKLLHFTIDPTHTLPSERAKMLRDIAKKLEEKSRN